MVKKKILITDAKVPLLWLRNKDLRTQPFVQTRVHGICKRFDPDEMYYIKSRDNPADIGTKFDNFKNTYKILGDDSLFRQGPRCLRRGIKEAVRRNDLIPIGKISPSSEEKDSAALEVVKLHQLVITENQNENLLLIYKYILRVSNHHPCIDFIKSCLQYVECITSKFRLLFVFVFRRLIDFHNKRPKLSYQ